VSILCTENLIESGVVDLIYNGGWQPATPAILRAAQHGHGRGYQLPLPARAVIACYGIHLPEVLSRLHHDNHDGKYVLIVRDCDQSVRDGGGPNCNTGRWPSCVFHTFAINSIDRSGRATPMPSGVWAFKENAAAVERAMEVPRTSGNRVLVAHRYDGGGLFKPGHERLTSIDYFRDKPWATVHPTLLDLHRGQPTFHLWPHDKYLALLRSHEYLVAPMGYGVERAAIWEAALLGAIPICYRHPELAHFANDLPLALVDDWRQVTPEWCDANLGLASRSCTELMTETWVERIRQKREELLALTTTASARPLPAATAPRSPGGTRRPKRTMRRRARRGR
jgi:hypothetical protein